MVARWIGNKFSEFHRELPDVTLVLQYKSMGSHKKKTAEDFPWNTGCFNKDPYNG